MEAVGRILGRGDGLNKEVKGLKSRELVWGTIWLR